MIFGRRLPLSVVYVCLAATAPAARAAQDAQDVPLTTWSAPPFWSAPAAPADSSAAGRTALGREPLTVGPTPLPFVALTSCRVVDTRFGFGGAIVGGTAASYTIKGANAVDGSGPCGVPSDAQAVSINLTVVGSIAAGNLALGPSDKPKPGTSTINLNPAIPNLANAAVVGLAAATPDLTAFFNGPAWATVNVIIDVNGYYAPSGIVNSVNGLFGNVSLSGGGSTSVSQNGNGFIVSSSATLTGVTAGAGLTGGGTSGNPTLALAANGVTAGNIAPFQVVKNLNGLTEGVTLAGGNAITVTPNGNTLTIDSAGISGFEFVSQTFADSAPYHGFASHRLTCTLGKRMLGSGAYTDNATIIPARIQPYNTNLILPIHIDSIYVDIINLCDPSAYAGCTGSVAFNTTLWLTCGN